MEFQPGMYYVGDPAYIIEYDKFFDFKSQVVPGVKSTWDMRDYVMFESAEKSGVFSGSDDKEFSVDTGMIGIVRLLDPSDTFRVLRNQLGHIYKKTEPFTVYNFSGILVMDKLSINTNWSIL